MVLHAAVLEPSSSVMLGCLMLFWMLEEASEAGLV